MTEISFIIQGEVCSHINRQIEEIRKFFPKSQVIVSSCFPCEYEIIGADNVIISDDPGFFYYSQRPGEKVNNVNRQIVTTLAGLKVCKTEYAFKLRSDFFLTGKSFLQFFDGFPKVDKEYQVFEHKILSCNYFARNPQSDMPFPFHPSDVAFFGKTTDLRKMFDIPLMTKEDAYFDVTNVRFNRYVPEQHIFINCLRKNGFAADCNFYNDVSAQNIEQTERYFASNFIFLSFEQFNLKPTKPTFSMRVHPNAFMTCYTHYDWLQLYRKYVDNTISLPKKDEERGAIEKCYRVYRKYRFLSNLCALPFRNKAKRRQIRNAILEYFLK